MERKQAHLHVEKAAGTTIIDCWDKMYGAENVLLMNPETKMFYRSSEGLSRTNPLVDKMKVLLGNTPIYPLITRINRATNGQSSGSISLEQVPSEDFKVVHGHFKADIFDDLIENPRLTVVLRDPLERMVSHYCHWKRNGGHMLQRTDLPTDPGMKYEKFFFLPELRNFQTKSLGNHVIEDFDVVGTTDNLDSFVNRVASQVAPDQIGSIKLRRLNRNPSTVNYEELGITSNFKIDFYNFHREDYDNYERAKNLA